MKKLTAMILALVLALTLGCAALAEEETAGEITIYNWLVKTLTDTNWTQKGGDATLEIQPILDETAEEQFEVVVRMPGSETECTEWTFYCNFNTDNQALCATEELTTLVTLGADGEPEKSANVNDEASEAMITLDESGLLILNGAKDEQISVIGFEPVPAEAEKLTALTEEQAALFAKTTEGLLGVDYEAIGLVREADYMLGILCKGTVVVPDAKPSYYLAVINDGAEGRSVVFFDLTGTDDSEG